MSSSNPDKPFRDCVARYDLMGVPHCTHPRSGYTKKPITPDICDRCQTVVGDAMIMPAPSLISRARSVGKAVRDVIIDPTPAPPDEVERREAICNACKYKSGRSCRACGCNLYAKQRMLTWTCDLGFWDEQHQSPDVGTSGSSPPIVPPPEHNGGL